MTCSEPVSNVDIVVGYVCHGGRIRDGREARRLEEDVEKERSMMCGYRWLREPEFSPELRPMSHTCNSSLSEVTFTYPVLRQLEVCSITS